MQTVKLSIYGSIVTFLIIVGGYLKIVANPPITPCAHEIIKDNQTVVLTAGCAEFRYEYTVNDETYDLHSFRIARKTLNTVTNNTLHERANIDLITELVSPNATVGDNGNFNMYIEYYMPAFYFDAVTGEKRICNSFRDCPTLFKHPSLRVRNHPLNTYLRFCALSISVPIAINLNTSAPSLHVDYETISVLTIDEKNTIDELYLKYPNSPVYGVSMTNKGLLYIHNKTSNKFVVDNSYEKLRDGYGYMTNTFYDYRTNDTRVGILKEVTNDVANFNVLDVISGDYDPLKNSFGYTFRKRLTAQNRTNIAFDSNCTATNNVMSNIFKNVQDAVVTNIYQKTRINTDYQFCLNGKVIPGKELPCSRILGLKTNAFFTTCKGLEDTKPFWIKDVTFPQQKDPLDDVVLTLNDINEPFNEQTINANMEINNLLISIEEYKKIFDTKP